jgi:hypothetical protein
MDDYTLIFAAALAFLLAVALLSIFTHWAARR